MTLVPPACWIFRLRLGVVLFATAVCAALVAQAADRPATAGPSQEKLADPLPAHGASVVRRTTDDLADLHAAAVTYGRKYGPDRVLLVYDIDNTLLAMNQDLGSDQWFQWQRQLIEENADSPQAVARDLDGLLEAQGLLFTLSRMHPPQADAPGIVADLQSRGFPSILITSRGDAFRTAAERELARNGYEAAKTALPVKTPCEPIFLPYDPSNLEGSGFSVEEVESLELGEPKRVSYCSGVFMIAGQHKGAMLRTLLARCDKQISAIVFVDDRARHQQAVCAAFANRGIDIAAFYYTREQQRIERFQASDKGEVVRGWQELQKTLKTVFE